MMYQEPSDSPWGLVVRCDTLCPGVYSVSTAGHGGIMAQIDAARLRRFGQRYHRTPDG